MKDFFKAIEDAPAMLDAKDIHRLMPNISRAGIYNLLRSEGFPVITIGNKRKFVPKEAFVKWIETHIGT